MTHSSHASLGRALPVIVHTARWSTRARVSLRHYKFSTACLHMPKRLLKRERAALGASAYYILCKHVA